MFAGWSSWVTVNALFVRVLSVLIAISVTTTSCSTKKKKRRTTQTTSEKSGGTGGQSWSDSTNTIDGRVVIDSLNLNGAALTAGSCQSLGDVYLVKVGSYVDNDIIPDGRRLFKVKPAADGTFTFPVLKNIGVVIDPASEVWRLECTGCGKYVSRILTSVDNQNLTQSTTAVDFALENAVIQNQDLVRSYWLYGDIDTLATAVTEHDSAAILVQAAQSDPKASAAYQNLFGTTNDLVTTAPPRILSTSVNTTPAVNYYYQYSATFSRFDSDQIIWYEWYLDGAIVSTAASYQWSPTFVQIGDHELELRVGSSPPGNNNHSVFNRKTWQLNIIPESGVQAAPQITLFTLSGTTIINSLNQSSIAPLTLIATTQATSVTYAVVNALATCDDTVTYDLTAPPAPANVTAEGIYKICAMATNTVSPIKAFAESPVIRRKTSLPSITTATLANSVADGFLALNESSLNDQLIIPVGSDYDNLSYALLPSPANCDDTTIFSFPSVPINTNVTADGQYFVCIKASDLAGNPPAFASSLAFNRITSTPSVGSFNLANAASAGSVNLLHASDPDAAVSIVATNFDVISYAIATPSTICASLGLYPFNVEPLITDIFPDGTYKICAKITKNYGGTIYAETTSFVRDTTVPVVSLTSIPGGNPDATRTPTILGSVSKPSNITLFDDSTCSNAVSATVTNTTFSASGLAITTDLPANTSTPIYAQAVDYSGNKSTCSVLVSYTHDDSVPTIVNVSSSTSNGSYKEGQLITIQLTFSEPVTVSGIPRLTLKTTPANTEATYVSGSGTNTLNFSYTVGANDTASLLDYNATNALTLSASSIRDLSGNNVIVTLPAPGTSGSLSVNNAITIDTAPPTISFSSLSPSSPGNTLIPQISVNLSESSRANSLQIFSDNACQTPASIAISGVAGSNQITVSAVTPGSTSSFYAKMSDLAGNGSTCTFIANYVNDNIPPVTTSVTSSLADGSYKAGQIVLLQARFSEAVAVTGNPTLSLNTTPSAATAVYVSGSGTDTLVFRYTVGINDNSALLEYASTAALIAGSSIKDVAGNIANVALPSPGASGSISSNKSITIDTIAPIVSYVSANPSSPSNSDTPDLLLNLSEVTQAEGLQIFTDVHCLNAISAAANGASSHNTVTTASLPTNVSTSIYAKATDVAGNESLCTSIVVYTNDNILPSITSFRRSVGQNSITNSLPVNFTITFSETLNPTSVASLDFSNGGTATGVAWSVSDSGDHKTFTVSAASAGNGTVQPILAASSVSDLAGNDNAASPVMSSQSVAYSAAAFTVTLNQSLLQADPTNSASIAFDVVFSSPVGSASFTTSDIIQTGTATGITWSLSTSDNINWILSTASISGAGTIIPSIAANIVTDLYGNQNAAATSSDTTVTYDPAPPTISFTAVGSGNPGSSLTPTILGTVSKSSTVTLYFDAACTSAKSAGDGNAIFASPGITLTSPVAANALTQIYAKAIDNAGNPSTCTSLVSYIHDNLPPTVAGVTSSLASGKYKSGQSIPIQVVMSEVVTVLGTPTLTLNTTPTPTDVTYVSGSGTSTLNFTYVVGLNDTSATLDYLNTSALTAGSYIKDTTGNDATLNLATPGSASSLAANRQITIDTTIPTLAFSSFSPTSPGISQTPQVLISLSESSQTGGIEIFSDNSCSAAISSATTGSAGITSVTTSTLSAGSTTAIYARMFDLAGNASACTYLSTYTHDDTAPSLTGVTSTLANGNYKSGQNVNIQVTFSEAVNVTGTPTLTLNTTPVNRVASYTSGSGTNTLNFSYTVGGNDSSSALEYLSTSALTSGTSIKDVAGNNAQLTLPSPSTTGSLSASKIIVIDTTAPTISYVSTSPTSPGSNQTPQIVVNTSEASLAGGLQIFSDISCSLAVSAPSTAAQGNNTITTSVLGANAATSLYAKLSDLAGNSSACTNLVVYTHDNVSPTVVSFARAAGQGALTNSLPVNFTISFSEPLNVSSFTSVSISNAGTANGVTWTVADSGDHQTFTVAATASGNGTLLPMLAASSVTDIAGNSIAASTNTASQNVDYSAAIYTVTVNQTAGQSDPTNTIPVTFTVIFSGAVGASSFSASDIIQNGTATGVTWAISTSDSVSWTLTATSISNAGSLAPTIAAGSVVDIYGNANSASTATDNTVTYDPTPPIVTFSAVGTGNPGSSLTPTILGSVSKASTLTLYHDASCSIAKSSNTANTIFASPGIVLSSNVNANTTTTIYGKAIDAAGNSSPCTSLVTYNHDNIVPTVLGINTTLASGSYKAGQIVPIQVTMSEVVTVAGTPTLTLNTTPINAVATYVSGSGSGTLNFTYTVAASETSPALDYASISALTQGTSITDAAANNANLALSASGQTGSISATKQITIDTTVPSITFTSISPVSPGSSQTPQLVMNLSEASQTGGLQLFSDNVCATPISPTVTGLSGANSVTTSTLSAGSTTTIHAKISDPAGNISNCSYLTTYVQDSAAPTVTGVSSTLANGSYKAGQSVSIQVSFSETVNVIGTPTLTLNTAPVNAVATYLSGSGSNTLNFSYVVASNDTSATLDYVASTSLTLGSSIKDTAGNNAALTLPTPASAGSLGSNKSLVIDTTSPTITYVSTSPSTPSSSQTPQVIVSTSEASQVNGLRLYKDNACSSTASNAVTGVTGNNTITTSSVTANNATTLFGLVTDLAGNTSACTSLIVYTHDNIAPTVTSFIRAPGQSAFTNSLPINFAITFSEPLTAASFLAASLSNSGTATSVTWVVTDSGDHTTFNIAATASDDGTLIPVLAASSVMDAASNTIAAASNTASQNVSYGSASYTVTLNQSLGQADPTNTLPISFTVVFSSAVDGGTFTTADIVQNGTASGITWALSSGDNITWTLTATAITNAGSLIPSIAANSVFDAYGNSNASSTSTDNAVTYDITAPVLTFNSLGTSNPGSSFTPAVLGTSSEPSTVTLYYDAGCAAAKSAGTSNVILASPGITPTGFVNGNATTTIYGKAIDGAGNASTCTNLVSYTNDSIGPSVSGVTSSTANGSYRVGQVISIKVMFSEAVIVTGTPILTLNTTPTTTVNYASGSGSNTLTFTYTIAAGTNASSLDYASTSALTAGAAIQDSSGNAASLILPSPGAAGSLSANRQLAVDTTTPTISFTSISPVSPGSTQTPSLIVNLSEASQPGGLVLYSDNLCSTSVSGSMTGVSGSNTVMTYALPANATTVIYGKVTDLAGNASTCANLTTYTHDGIAPTVLVFAKIAGQNSSTNSVPINFTMTFSEPLNVSTFADSDISNAGTATGVTWQVTDFGDHTTFALAATASGSGTIQPRLGASSVSDLAGNSTAATSITSTSTVNYSSSVLNVTVNQAAGQNDPTNALPASFTVVFSSAVGSSSFTTSDIVQSGTASGVSWALSTSDNITWTLNAISIASAGSIMPSIDANTVVDAFGNSNQASTSSDNSVSYDNAVPTLTFTSVSTGNPGNSLTPTIKGSASKVSTVTLYFDAACSAAKSAGTANTIFTSTGITLTSNVNQNASTTIYGKAVDAAGNQSSCTNLVTYTNDSTAPVVSNVTSSTADGFYNAGNSISIQITFSKIVYVTGIPTITLATGPSPAVVNYASGSGTSTLTFTYTIATGDNASDLDYSATTALTAGTSIQDATGNNAALALPSPGSIGSLGVNKALVVDTVMPTITFISTTPASPANSLTPSVSLTLSETTSPAGLILYSNNNCSAAVSNGFNGVAGTNNITTTMLTANQSTSIYAMATDKSGNASLCTMLSTYLHDGITPTITSIATTSTTGVYSTGASIAIVISFSEAVNASGTPTLSLNTTPSRTAAYSSGSGTNQLTFIYTAIDGDASSRLDYSATTALTGTIKDAALNAASLTLPIVGTSSLFSTNLLIDTLIPAVTGVISTLPNGAYNADTVIPIQVTFNDIVHVTGSPIITLNTAPTQTAIYSSGSGTSQLIFNYTVQSGDTVGVLDYQSSSALTLNGGTIKDSSNLDASLALAAVGAADSLGASSIITIDTTAPSVTNVTSSTGNDTYSVGSQVNISVSFNEVIQVTGVPRIQLNINNGASTVRYATYSSGNGSGTLVFSYTVIGPNDTTGDYSGASRGTSLLDYASSAALSLNGGSIGDAASNPATLTLASPGSAGSISYNRNLIIDSSKPPALSISGVTCCSVSKLRAGSNELTVQLPASVANYNAVKVYRILGNTAPTSCSGTLVATYNPLFTPGSTMTFVDATGNPGKTYSYQVCALDVLSNPLATATATNIKASNFQYMFTTSTAMASGNLGGVAGANNICQTAGNNYDSSLTWVALISDSEMPASGRAPIVGAIYNTRAIAVSSVATATDTLTTSAAHGLTANQAVQITHAAQPAPLAASVTYYVLVQTTTTLKLAATSGGAAIDITSAGTGINIWTNTPQTATSGYAGLWGTTTTSLTNAISFSELGGALTGSSWTGTSAAGGRVATNCSNWGSNLAAVTGGRGSVTSKTSTFITNATSACNVSTNRLMCVSLAMQPLTSFTVSTPAANSTPTPVAGDVEINITFPSDTTNWSKAEVRRIFGATAPTCSTGTVAMTFDGTITPFTSGTYVDRTNVPSKFFRYAVCVYTGTSVAASYTLSANPVRTYRANPAYVVFVTSTAHAPSTFYNTPTAASPLTNADSLCTTRAQTFITGKTWKAIMSDATTGAQSRLGLAANEVRNLNGDLVVSSGAALFGPLTTAIRYQDNFAASAATSYTWTGTSSTGTPSTGTCSGWSATNGNTGTNGRPTGTANSGTSSWINRSTTGSCTTSYRLYCISTAAD